MENNNTTAHAELTNLCKSNGKTISEMCFAAGVDPGAFRKWKNEDPKTIQTYKKLKAAALEPVAK